ncbi:MAG: exosortase system-associated protein, TIGR04073 family [Akkermansia sp.]
MSYIKNTMKRALYTFLFLGMIGSAVADIQAPPAAEYTSSRKLGRALSNIFYAAEEIPTRVGHWTNLEGDYAGGSVGIVDGTSRMLQRMGYGFYELVTFWAPTYKCTYRPPYQDWCGQSGLREYNPNGGFSEFPPELGFQSYYSYSRTEKD